MCLTIQTSTFDKSKMNLRQKIGEMSLQMPNISMKLNGLMKASKFNKIQNFKQCGSKLVEIKLLRKNQFMLMFKRISKLRNKGKWNQHEKSKIN